MVCSILIHAIKAMSPHVHVLFYTDNLLLYIPLPLGVVCRLLAPIFEHLRIFGMFVGLKPNVSKSAFLTKGGWTEGQADILRSYGIVAKLRVKYLGFLLGHVTSEEAYAPVIARATRRAPFMNHLAQPIQRLHSPKITLVSVMLTRDKKTRSRSVSFQCCIDWALPRAFCMARAKASSGFTYPSLMPKSL